MRGRRVCVVGGGNAAGQAAAHLAKYADEVTLLVRGDSLRDEHVRLPDRRARRAAATSRSGSACELVDGDGDDQLVAVVVRDRASGATERIPTAGLFVMIGAEPHTDWLEGIVARDERGFILTGRDSSATDGRPISRCCWRRASPACSPPATSATARSSASRPRWATAPPSSTSSTIISAATTQLSPR